MDSGFPEDDVCACVLNNNPYSHAQTMLLLLWYEKKFLKKANIGSLVVPSLIDCMWSAGIKRTFTRACVLNNNSCSDAQTVPILF